MLKREIVQVTFLAELFNGRWNPNVQQFTDTEGLIVYILNI